MMIVWWMRVDLVFTHEHPNDDDSIPMDETYRRQNDNAKYAEAKAIFLERNPEAKKRWFMKDHWSASSSRKLLSQR